MSNDTFEFFSWGEAPLNKYKQPKPNTEGTGENGYPQTDVKTKGVETRGNGAATKGTKAYGPMA